ncbi:MAG TPA: zinc ribbon domain-containing protein [Dehalococcoidia bacterium]
MKISGVILLVLGTLGLLLDLLFWLPAKFSPVVAALIGTVCLVVVWGGGRMSQTVPAALGTGRHEAVSSQMPSGFTTTATPCPKCGCQVMPGQQFCGGCGSSLVSYCAKCGNTVAEPSKFCGRCGARLS